MQPTQVEQVTADQTQRILDAVRELRDAMRVIDPTIRGVMVIGRHEDRSVGSVAVGISAEQISTVLDQIGVMKRQGM